MLSHKTAILLAMGIILILGNSRLNAAIIQHLGNTNPESEGWTLGGGTAGAAGSVAGEDGWELQNNHLYVANGLLAANPSTLSVGWKLEARMALLATPGGDNDISLNVRDGQDLVQTTWQGANWNVANQNGIPQFAAAHPGLNTYADYRIEYSAATGVFSFFLNDVLATTRTSATLENSAAVDQIRWSQNNSVNGEVWSLVRFDVLPEPACLSLVAMGGLMLARRRRI